MHAPLLLILLVTFMTTAQNISVIMQRISDLTNKTKTGLMIK